MLKRLSIGEVKKRAKEIGYWEVLGDVYKNAHIKLTCRCLKCDRIHKIGWNAIQQGKRCRCHHKALKLTIEEVKRRAKAIGIWEILDDVYMGAHVKLKCKCIKCGYRHKVIWSNIQKKSGCPICFATEIGNKFRHNIEFIRAEFAKEGYILLTEIYENAHQKLEYICSGPEKHRHSITWGSWSGGTRCPFCNNTAKPTIEHIRAQFEKEGYILLTKVYENNTQKLEYICPRGHRRSISWSGWQRNQRCPCFSGLMKLNIEFIRTEFAKEGYILLTKTYDNNKQKLEYECPMGHIHSVSWGNWKFNKRRCPFCNDTGVSKWEKAVKKFLGESNIDHISNDRTQLLNPETGHNLELDIWFPDLNKAIECNGIYWHGKEQAIKNDKIKQQLCEDQGINLLVITDEEWKEDTGKCKTKIKNFVTGE